MSTSKNRRLAAILFADIVGYTAMMQSYRPENHEAALPIYESLLRKANKQKVFRRYIFYKKKDALLHAKLNKMATAKFILSELKAISWLKQAFQNGYDFSAYRYDNDLDLQALKGETTWDDFIKPIMTSDVASIIKND